MWGLKTEKFTQKSSYPLFRMCRCRLIVVKVNNPKHWKFSNTIQEVDIMLLENSFHNNVGTISTPRTFPTYWTDSSVSIIHRLHLKVGSRLIEVSDTNSLQTN